MMLIRKDLPLQSTMTFFETKIDDEKMDKQIIKHIDKGDKINHKSNVKADMTEWTMQSETGFKKLAKIILDMAVKGSKERYNRIIKPRISDMWGMRYKSGEQAIMHDHWPALWSFAYYLNAPKDAPGLFFPDLGEQGGERKLEKGLLVMFEGYIRHAVRKSKFKGYRYVVSGNLHEVHND